MISEYETFITSLNAFSETVAIFYKGLRKQGFSCEQAMELTKTFLTVAYTAE